MRHGLFAYMSNTRISNGQPFTLDAMVMTGVMSG